MRLPLDGDARGIVYLTQLFGSLRGGPGEAYTAEHVIDGQVVSVFCAGHPGYDLDCSPGSRVYAMRGGTVHWPGIAEGYRTALGEYAVVVDEVGAEWWYAHLSAPQVPEGAHVAAGQLIALSGYTGNVSPPGPQGAHLHIAKRPAKRDYHAYDGFVPFLHQFDHQLYARIDASRV